MRTQLHQIIAAMAAKRPTAPALTIKDTTVSYAELWDAVRAFVKAYGSDLLTVPFLGLSNMRGILARGVKAWLDHEAEHGTGERRENGGPPCVHDLLAAAAEFGDAAVDELRDTLAFYEAMVASEHDDR